MRWLISVSLASILGMAPLGAKAAELVVWWEKGYYDQEDEAVAEIVAAFEQQTGNQVELVFLDEEEHTGAIAAALDAGQPPDFAFGTLMSAYISEWAFGDRLVVLSDAIGSFANIFDSDALDRVMLVNAKTGQKALYGVPIDRTNHHIHVWRSLLEQAGFTLADIPREWNAFWQFWCDDVQPAVHQATGRGDIWGIGLPMSGVYDTQVEFIQFVAANQAEYVTRDGRLVIDDPEIRRKLVGLINSYATIFKKGCTPPDSVAWGNVDNNKAFLAQTVVMTANHTLSIPNALKRERPDDSIRPVLRSSGRSVRMASPALLRATSTRRSSSRTVPTSLWPRRSSVFSWPMAGLLTISTSRPSACCRRSRHSSSNHSGSTRAIHTGWPQ